MKRIGNSACMALGLVFCSSSPFAQSLEEALRETTPMLSWRLRYEGVDQAGFSQGADALTSRLRAGFQTGIWGRTSLLGEAVWTDDLNEDFNSTTNGQTQYPVVADPGGFVAVNRFALTNESLAGTTLTFGRQRIVLDDSRFVGNVGWRQNEQTYDGLRVRTGTERVDVDITLTTQINRVFGPDSPAGKWHGDIALVNVSGSLGIGKLTGFFYGLDIDEAAGLSTNTTGLRLSGSKPIGELAAVYTLSFARQTDTGANAADFSESYYLAEAGIKRGPLTVSLGYEQLSSDGINAVTTPLATLHAFQGWADKFVNTPAGGIGDRYASASYAVSRAGPFESLSLVGVLHDFESDIGNAHYGTEIDLSIVARIGRSSLTLKYANYEADALLTDTEKLWFSLDYAF